MPIPSWVFVRTVLFTPIPSWVFVQTVVFTPIPSWVLPRTVLEVRLLNYTIISLIVTICCENGYCRLIDSFFLFITVRFHARYNV